VGRPHGLDGAFRVTAPRNRLLAPGVWVKVAGKRTRIAQLGGQATSPIVQLEGVVDREGAQALRGQELFVRVEEAPRLDAGEWWAHELEGCSVHDGAQELGEVRSLVELPSCEALEVLCADGATLLIPMVHDAIKAVDMDGKRIEVDTHFLGERP
jgi:16S rRNA processing protein RimM